MSPRYKGNSIDEVAAIVDKVKRVGIFIRVSTDMQVEAESPAVHEHRARAYAASKGWQVVEIYRLEGVSGKSTIDHPETARMFDDLARGHISGVIISKLARLGRNTKELIEMADRFRQHHALMVSLEEAIDTSTPAGRLFYTMIAGMAQWEREEIASRIKAAVETRAKMGLPTNGRAVIGYHWVDRKLVPLDSEKAVRVRILVLFREYRRLHPVAKQLKEEGFKMRNGKPFTGAMVKSLIEDTTAIGIHKSFYTFKANGKRGIKPEKDWVFNEVEPIVDRELWQLCNDILKANRPASCVFAAGDLVNIPSLVSKLKDPGRPFDVWLASQLSAGTEKLLAAYNDPNLESTALENALLLDFGIIIRRTLIFDEGRFAGITLRPETQALISQNPQGGHLRRLHRMLFEDAYPAELSRNCKRSPGRQSLYLFGNIMWCHCGQKMYVSSNSLSWFTCSKCRNRVDRDGLERVFVEQIRQVFASDSNVAALIEESNRVRLDVQTKIVLLEKEKSRIPLQVAQAFDLHEKGNLSDEGFGKRSKELEERMKTLLSEIALTKEKLDPSKAIEISPEQVSADAEKLFQAWPTMPFDEKKGLIESLTTKIIVHKDTLDFHFAEAPSLHPVTKRLCKLIATQPFCHMIITCHKPTEPPKTKTPQKGICHKHTARIERLVMEHLPANIIFERLRNEGAYKGSYPTLAKFVRQVRNRLFPGIKFAPRKPGTCEPYRDLITNLIKEGQGPKDIYEHLKENTSFSGSQVAVQLYSRRLKKKLVSDGVAIPDLSTCAAHRQYIVERTRVGATPMRILKELQQKFEFRGTYRAVYLCADQVKKEALEAGTPIQTGRSVCFQFSDLIHAKVKRGIEAPEIFHALKSETQFTGSYEELRRFVWRYKQHLKAQGVSLPPRKNSCSVFRDLIRAKILTGLSTKQVFEALKAEVQFTGSYVRLRRFVKQLRQQSI